MNFAFKLDNTNFFFFFSDLAARKNYWGAYMNKLNMNSFGSQYDEQPQLPVNKEVVDNKLFY